MGKLWYFSYSKGSVFVKYVDGTEFVKQQSKAPFGAVHDVTKSRKHSENQHALDVHKANHFLYTYAHMHLMM